METKKTTPAEFEKLLTSLEDLTPAELKRVQRLTFTLGIMQTIPEKDKADAEFFKAALKADIDAGTITPGKLRGYVAAIQESLCPIGMSLNPAECALSELDRDFRTLENTLDRLLNDTLPPYRDRLGEISMNLLMDIDAATDIYNHFTEEIREKIDKGLDD